MGSPETNPSHQANYTEENHCREQDAA
jgi:hypothetical protein